MNVSRYLFQSPYNNQVQVGKLDTSAKQESNSTENIPIQDEILKKAENFQNTQTKEITPSVESPSQIDLYV